MDIDLDTLRDWMERIMERFDSQDEKLDTIISGKNIVDGEKLLDNQNVCEMLNISKRTLQRYRSSGELPFEMIYHKTYYKEADVKLFIQNQFDKRSADLYEQDDKE